MKISTATAASSAFERRSFAERDAHHHLRAQPFARGAPVHLP